MADCLANTTFSQLDIFITASNAQACINRLYSYWTKYNDTDMQAYKRIGATYSFTETNNIKETSIDAADINRLQTILNNYIKHFDNSGSTWSFTASNIGDKITQAEIYNIYTKILDLEPTCWACHSGDSTLTCSVCHLSAHSCPNDGHTCTCDNTCYIAGYSVCTCNATTHGFVCDTCNATCYSTYCSPNAACTDKDSCGCYSNYVGCTSCDNTCFNYSCTCNNSCYSSDSPCTCHNTCHNHSDSCSCNTTCYQYTGSCYKCYSVTY